MKKKSTKGIIIGAVAVLLLGYGLLANNSSKTGNETPETAEIAENSGGVLNEDNAGEAGQTEEAAPTEQTETGQEEQQEEVAEHRTGDNIIGISEKDIDELKPTAYDTVRNDVTGRWKCLVIAQNNIDITEYALSCYKKYFDSDDTVLAVENLTTKTSTSINNMGTYLYVSVYEYVDGEEHDAKAMFSGMHLGDYMVYTDNGDIEKITED